MTDVKGIDRFLGPTEEAQRKNASCFRRRNIGQSLEYSVGVGTFPRCLPSPNKQTNSAQKIKTISQGHIRNRGGADDSF